MIRLLLLLLFMLARCLAFSCHKCASERAVMNWSRYDLPMLQGDSMEGDDSCLHESRLQDGISCPGLCMTINVTAASGPYEGKTVGIVRDCQPHHKRKNNALQDGETKTCKSHQKIIRRNYVVNVTYCYCAGNYCNGGSGGDDLPASRSSHQSRRTSHRSAPSAASAIPYFLPFVLGIFL